MKRYSIGFDYGSLSVRGVLVSLENGLTVDSEIFEYKNKVITKEIPGTNIKLKSDWALQDPKDYVEGFLNILENIKNRNIEIYKDVVGIGIDFTSCTVMPITDDGIPMCNLKEFRNNPHSWVKLWKHHASQKEADILNELAHKTNQSWIKDYGGKISSEWMVPKILQIANEDPNFYSKIGKFIEATDWIVMEITGKERRNSLTAGFKAIYNNETKQFPGKEFYKSLNPLLENFVDEKLSKTFYEGGYKAGNISKKYAELTGLNENVAICVGLVDAHVSIASTKVIEPNNMLMIMGTSTCDILLSKEKKPIGGICGVVKDCIIPGYYVYESGQNAVGDSFAWFVENCVPRNYFDEAAQLNVSIHEHLTNKAKKLSIGESGLIALDWFNGNRTVLVDNNLTGLMIGMNLSTKPEEIYRTLLESTAFGKRIIIENFENSGIKINKLTACGGLPKKNSFLMQMYADICNKEIFISSELQAPAYSAALYGAVAAGTNNGGFENIIEASKKMGKLEKEPFKPIKENVEKYEAIYREFKKLHEYFGKENLVMKKLKELKGKSKNA